MSLRKILALIFSIFILSGCATYKFQKPATSGSQGYLVSYDNKSIIEYTVGRENSLPDLRLAKERFRRRRSTVEYYYKKTGQIESRFKENFWDFPEMFVDFAGGVLRWPFIAVSDYRYNRDPKYKERSDKLEEEREAFEKARINSFKEKLKAYIAKDLDGEHLSAQSAVAARSAALKSVPPQALSAAPEPLPQTQETVVKTENLAPAVLPGGSHEMVPLPAQETTSAQIPVSAIAPAQEEVILPVKPAQEPVITLPGAVQQQKPPVAVIIAKPAKGYSPLKVKFSGQKSYSKSGKIVSYFWDFGDGDTSAKKNPENTYWSTTYGLRKFTASLTVKDEAGSISSATVIIEVSTL